MTLIRPVLVTVLVALLLVGGYHRIRADNGEAIRRRAEGWLILIGIRLTALALALVIGRLFWVPGAFAFAELPLAPLENWAGVAILVVAAAWMMWMDRSLGTNITDTVVTRRDSYFVRSGPYRYVRNPMYLGVLALTIGIGLGLGNAMPVALGSITFVFLAVRTRIEERFLLERFPADYARYMNEVGRFLPRLAR